MKKIFIWVLLIFSLLFSFAPCFGSELYPASAPLYFEAYETWAQKKIASGTVTPPIASAAENELFLNVATPTQTKIQVLVQNAWRDIGVTDLSGVQPIASMSFYQPTASMADYLLANTAATEYVGSSAFATERNNRIASEAAIQALIPNNASHTLSGLSERNFSSLQNTPTTLLGYGITDGGGSGGIPNPASTGANIFTDHQAIPTASITGNLSVDGSLTLATGTATNLAFRLRGDENTGIYSSLAGRIDFITGGTQRLYIASTGVVGAGAIYAGGATSGRAVMSASTPTATLPAFTFAADTTTGLGRNAAGQPSMIAAGTEIQRWGSTSTQIGTGTIAGIATSTLSIFDNSNSSYTLTLVRFSSDARSPGLRQFKSRGTTTASSPILLGDKLLEMSAYGNAGAAFVEGGEIKLHAAENFTATSAGTHWEFQAVPIGTTTAKMVLEVLGSGNASVSGNVYINGGTEQVASVGALAGLGGGGIANPASTGANIFLANQQIVGSLTVVGITATGVVTVASGTTRGIVFDNDPDTGLHSQQANGLALKTGGAARITITTDVIFATTSDLYNNVNGSWYLSKTNSVTQPAHTFMNDYNSGLYNPGNAGKVAITADGTEVQRWDNASTSIWLPAYFASDVSALSFTDRSDAPDTLEQAYEIVQSHETLNGKINHAVLSPHAWGKKTRMETTGRTITRTEEKLVQIPLEEQQAVEPGQEPETMRRQIVTEEVPEMRAVEEPAQDRRNISMVISAQAMVLKDQAEKIRKLEERLDALGK